MSVDTDVGGLDTLSKEFLRVVKEYGGEADTTMIRTETGMKKSEVQYRFRKLEELGWIDIEKAEEGHGNRTPPKIAVLTEEGKQGIREGKAGGELAEEMDDERVIEVSKARIEEFEENIERVDGKVNGMLELFDAEEGVFEGGDVSREEFEDLENEVGRLRRTVEMVQESMGDSAESLGDDVDMMRPRVGLTQIYMRAFREMISEEFDDVPFAEYLEEAEADLVREDPLVDEFVEKRE